MMKLAELLGCDFLFRGLGNSDFIRIKDGKLFPKDIYASYTLTGHILSGSKLATQYISLTKSVDAARIFALGDGETYIGSGKIAIIDCRNIELDIVAYDCSTYDKAIKSMSDSLDDGNPSVMAANFAARVEEVVVDVYKNGLPLAKIVDVDDFNWRYHPLSNEYTIIRDETYRMILSEPSVEKEV